MINVQKLVCCSITCLCLSNRLVRENFKNTFTRTTVDILLVHYQRCWYNYFIIYWCQYAQGHFRQTFKLNRMIGWFAGNLEGSLSTVEMETDSNTASSGRQEITRLGVHISGPSGAATAMEWQLLVSFCGSRNINTLCWRISHKTAISHDVHISLKTISYDKWVSHF